MFRSSWSNAYLGIIPHLHLDSMIRKRTPDWWGATIKAGGELLVLQVSGVVAGYATLGAGAGARRIRRRDLRDLRFTHLSRPRLWRAPLRGLPLSPRRPLSCGLIVWALADNVAASDFYWRRGGRPVGMGFERFGRAKLKKIAFAWD